MNKLGIVIPAYKEEFIRETLNSIFNQTNKNFTLYICLDGTNENIERILNNYIHENNIIILKYENHLGSKSVVQHWNRSIKNVIEEWVWLFSDDDLMAPNCIEAFYAQINNMPDLEYNLLRFNLEMIDNNNKTILKKDNHPENESIDNFLQRRLKHECLSTAIDFIFKKSLFNKFNGFVDFPSAYCSDDATWLLFAYNKSIRTIPEGKVFWRQSGYNISSNKKYINNKYKAIIQYISWLENNDFKSAIQNLIQNYMISSAHLINGKPNIFIFLSYATKIIKQSPNLNIIYRVAHLAKTKYLE